jgi:hypothetical protein
VIKSLLLCNKQFGGILVEIHLDEEAKLPYVESLSNGLTKLVMSPGLPIETALQHCAQHLSESVAQQFHSLFTSREILRDFELVNGKVVVRPASEA